MRPAIVTDITTVWSVHLYVCHCWTEWHFTWQRHSCGPKYGYVHTDTSASPSPGFCLRVVCHSCKLNPDEWSVRGHLYKHI